MKEEEGNLVQVTKQVKEERFEGTEEEFEAMKVR